MMAKDAVAQSPFPDKIFGNGGYGFITIPEGRSARDRLPGFLRRRKIFKRSLFEKVVMQQKFFTKGEYHGNRRIGINDR